MRTIDLITDFQKISITQIREAYFRERTVAGEIVFEVGLWSGYVGFILSHYPDYKSLPPESVVYKFNWSDDYGDHTWGDDRYGEVEVDRLQEFYGHLKTIIITEDCNCQKEYDAILEICQSAIKSGNRLFFLADY